jgi:hypothetical protein
MPDIHYHDVWKDNLHVDKTTLRNAFRDFLQHQMTLAQLRATDLKGAKFVNVDGVPYALDAADTTTADDGASCVVSSVGARYKPFGPRYARNAITNLYSDSGAMGQLADVTGLAVGAFRKPGYFFEYNGGVLAAFAKYVFDSSSYGGAGAALASTVMDLMAVTRPSSPAARRYAPEFWVANLAAGAGTLSPVNVSGVNYYPQLIPRYAALMPQSTFRVQARAITGNLLFGAAAFVDDVARVNPYLITPAMGWVSVVVQDDKTPEATAGYSPAFSVSQPIGGVAQLARFALTPGVVPIPKSTELIPCAQTFGA